MTIKEIFQILAFVIVAILVVYVLYRFMRALICLHGKKYWVYFFVFMPWLTIVPAIALMLALPKEFFFAVWGVFFGVTLLLRYLVQNTLWGYKYIRHETYAPPSSSSDDESYTSSSSSSSTPSSGGNFGGGGSSGDW